MKRIVFALVLMCFPLIVPSQITKERRVYYLDCSYSMKTNGLWNKVRENLKSAIDKVSDETTELMVIPFAFDAQKSPKLMPISADATATGKAMIKEKIDKLPMNKNTMTYHYVPVKDFYDNRVAEDRITYMFLLTDGQDEDSQKKTLKRLLPQWGDKYGGKNVFGFYVMLCNDAKNAEIANVISKQGHLWKVETANVNINLIRLRDNLVFNKRNENELTIVAEHGTLSKCPIEVLETQCEGNYYEIEKIKIDNDKVVASIRALNNLSTLPEETVMSVCLKPISPSPANGFTCLVNDKISIKCKNKKERTLKLRFE